MQFGRIRHGLVLGITAVIVLLGALALPGRGASTDDLGAAEAAASDRLGCEELPALEPGLPGAPAYVTEGLAGQNDFNCFAWQEFIGLNWGANPAENGLPDPAATGATFGEPGIVGPVVWQTFKDADDVFMPGAVTPTAWDAPREVPEPCVAIADDGERPRTVLWETRQAGGTKPDPNYWLTGQNGQVVYYEVRMNQVEFDYIVENELYNAVRQYEAVQDALANGGKGIYFPKGTSEQQGAIEVKGAWLEITDPARYGDYLLSEAFIYNPDAETPECRKAVVGLVGMHIIQKSNDQWAWATFEHVNNAPSIEEIRHLDFEPYYNFYDHGCPNCRPNKRPTAGEQPRDQPTQAVRVKEISDVEADGAVSDNVDSLNTFVRDMVRAANPASVFQNYVLVNTGWPLYEVPTTSPTTAPLPYENVLPVQLANVTMETYLQDSNCTSCHAAATIAPSSKAPNPQWRADYSFLLQRADEPAAEE